MPNAPFLAISTQISNALNRAKPVVALESAVITHGLPYPDNLRLALEMEAILGENGSIPATIAVLDGKIRVGLSHDELKTLATHQSPRKISRRDFGIALTRKECGGTTVAGTLFAAHMAGIHVLATGGVGGVHRHAPLDVSADLYEMSRAPVVVVCAGPKAFLDIPATFEVLESLGVPVIGYQSDDFPAFYSRVSGLKVPARCDTAAEIAAIAIAHWNAGIRSAILVTNPLPREAEIPSVEIEALIHQAVTEAEAQGILGAGVTPFLLDRLNRLSDGKSQQANLALLHNNARLAAQIAFALVEPLERLSV